MDQRADIDDRIDGRTARRDRNRVAVLDAVLELFAEENLSPGVHEVAGRSGVSLRSVYRYFEDVDELISAAIDRQIDIARPLFLLPDLDVGHLDQRITRFTDGRVHLFDKVRPVFRAATARAAVDPRIRVALLENGRRLQAQTYEVFAAELGDDPAGSDDSRTVAVDLVCQFDALEYLFSVRGMDATRVARHVGAMLRTLLQNPA